MELPESISWFGEGWRYGPEYYYRINTFSMQAVVPVPAAAWLFGSGAIGLLGFSKRSKVA